MKHVQEFLRNYEPQKTLYQSLHGAHDDPVKSQVEEALRDGLDADTFKYVKSVFEVFGSFGDLKCQVDEMAYERFTEAQRLDCIESGEHMKIADNENYCMNCGCP